MKHLTLFKGVKEMDRVTITLFTYIFVTSVNVILFIAYCLGLTVPPTFSDLPTGFQFLLTATIFLVVVFGNMILTIFTAQYIRSIPRSDDSNQDRTRKIRIWFYRLEQLFS